MQKKLTNSLKDRVPIVYHTLKKVRTYCQLAIPAWFFSWWHPLTPISNRYGLDRGTPIDRFYIDSFIQKHQNEITGYCLEIRDNRYTKQYGTHVVKSEILDIDSENKLATIHDDLRHITKIADNTFDCIILTQVLQFIDQYELAVNELHRILKPGGVLLATVPVLSRIDPRAGTKNDFWRFTQAGVTYFFSKIFNSSKVHIEAQGNYYAGKKFWAGQCVEEVKRKLLVSVDPLFPLVITIHAQK